MESILIKPEEQWIEFVDADGDDGVDSKLLKDFGQHWQVRSDSVDSVNQLMAG